MSILFDIVTSLPYIYSYRMWEVRLSKALNRRSALLWCAFGLLYGLYALAPLLVAGEGLSFMRGGVAAALLLLLLVRFLTLDEVQRAIGMQAAAGVFLLSLLAALLFKLGLLRPSEAWLQAHLWALLIAAWLAGYSLLWIRAR